MKRFADSIKAFETPSSVLETIETLSQKVNIVSFVNAHAYTMANKDEHFQQCLLNADLLLRDGIGAKWLLQSYDMNVGYNANGTDLIPLICERFKDKTFCCIGTESPFIDQAVEKMSASSVQVLDYLDGFQDQTTMSEFVNKHQPDILILGMGMPRQEKFAEYLRTNYKNPILIVNGGAIFDFMANRFERAPMFFQRFGLEWFYRLLNEPKRLFGRYVIGIPKFAWTLFNHKRKGN